MFTMRRLPLRILAFLGLATLLVMGGCDDDNPAGGGGGPVCDHLDADGIVVETRDGTVLLHQWEGVVTGVLEIDADARLEGLQVWFLDADSTRVRPEAACVDHSLAWIVADTSKVTIEAHSGEPWVFDVQAHLGGETTVRLQVIHGDHADFTSLPLPVDVSAVPLPADPQGAVLRIDGREVARAAGSVVTGRLDVFTGRSSRTVDVSFLDDGGDEFSIAGTSGVLEVVPADPAAVSATIDGSSFSLDAVGATSTTVRIDVRVDGAVVFSSDAIPVTQRGVFDVGALLVTDGDDWAATAGFKISGAWGPVLVERATTREDLRIEVPDREDADFRFLDMLQLPAGITLDVDVANATIASVAPRAGDPFAFDLTGAGLGATSMTVTLLDEGTTLHTSPPIGVVVFEEGQGDATPTFQLRLNGRTEIGVVDGVLQAVDAQVCGSKVWMDHFEHSLSNPVGPLTSLIGVRVFDDGCVRQDLDDDDYHVAFVFADRGVARTTGHPEHSGELLNFHVEGVAPGTTSLRMVLLETATNAVVFVAPPIPVTIVP